LETQSRILPIIRLRLPDECRALSGSLLGQSAIGTVNALGLATTICFENFPSLS